MVIYCHKCKKYTENKNPNAFGTSCNNVIYYL